MTPTNVIGCKRLCVDICYWATFNQPHVTLVDVSDELIEASRPMACAPKARTTRSTPQPAPASTP
jgi:cyclohexanone monooxygenase